MIQVCHLRKEWGKEKGLGRISLGFQCSSMRGSARTVESTELKLPSSGILCNYYAKVCCVYSLSVNSLRGSDCGSPSRKAAAGRISHSCSLWQETWVLHFHGNYINSPGAGLLFRDLHLDCHQEKQLCWYWASKSNRPKLRKLQWCFFSLTKMLNGDHKILFQWTKMSGKIFPEACDEDSRTILAWWL